MQTDQSLYCPNAQADLNLRWVHCPNFLLSDVVIYFILTEEFIIRYHVILVAPAAIILPLSSNISPPSASVPLNSVKYLGL